MASAPRGPVWLRSSQWRPLTLAWPWAAGPPPPCCLTTRGGRGGLPVNCCRPARGCAAARRPVCHGRGQVDEGASRRCCRRSHAATRTAHRPTASMLSPPVQSWKAGSSSAAAGISSIMPPPPSKARPPPSACRLLVSDSGVYPRACPSLPLCLRRRRCSASVPCCRRAQLMEQRQAASGDCRSAVASTSPLVGGSEPLHFNNIYRRRDAV